MPNQHEPRAAQRVRVPWSRSDRPVPRRLIQPLQSFLDTESASGVLLLGAAIIALAWANAPFGDTYERLWTARLGIQVGALELQESLRGWINEGLMALFFLVVGLEIKRELLTGELRERRAAILPVVAALGGMIVPALVYLAISSGPRAAQGWSVAMPTDIAFALGLVTLAARGAPPGLKAFVLAMAMVDDLGSIIAIAVLQSDAVSWPWLVVAAGIASLIVILARIHVRAGAVYVVLGLGLWLGLHEAGVSAALAGVVAGLVTPAVPFQRPRAVSEEAHRVADDTVDAPYPPDADAPQWLSLAGLAREAVSPLARVENALHPWTSFLVVPVFALANAGVVISGDAFAPVEAGSVAVGIVVARVLGKLVGIAGASWLAVRLGVARLPTGVGWPFLLGAAAAAGVPFTVSLFLAQVALPAGLLGAAKVAILAAAVLAGALGWLVLSAAARSARRRAVERSP